MNAGGELTGRVARELPPHGSLQRARGRTRLGETRCPCPPCRRVERRYDKWRRVARETGRPLREPAAPVAEHLRSLLDTGMTWQSIADAAGCSRSTLSHLLRGQGTVRRSVAARILQVRPALSAAAFTDATGTVRRVRALYAAGWLLRDIADAAGIDRSSASELLGGEVARVREGTARGVRVAYWVLGRRTAPGGPGAVRARNRAAREGWAPPWAWGGNIEDPAAEPLDVVRIPMAGHAGV